MVRSVSTDHPANGILGAFMLWLFKTPVESLQNHRNDAGRRFAAKTPNRCFQHERRPALTWINGFPVCRECLQVCLDVYHEIALRGFDG